MDAFYASVELLRYPELRGQPVVIGGGRRHQPEEIVDPATGRVTRKFATLRGYAGRGVITTATYEARKFGLHSALGLMKAAALAPDTILLPTDFDAYRKYSRLFKAAVRVELLLLALHGRDVGGHLLGVPVEGLNAFVDFALAGMKLGGDGGQLAGVGGDQPWSRTWFSSIRASCLPQPATAKSGMTNTQNKMTTVTSRLVSGPLRLSIAIPFMTKSFVFYPALDIPSVSHAGGWPVLPRLPW